MIVTIICIESPNDLQNHLDLLDMYRGTAVALHVQLRVLASIHWVLAVHVRSAIRRSSLQHDLQIGLPLESLVRVAPTPGPSATPIVGAECPRTLPAPPLSLHRRLCPLCTLPFLCPMASFLLWMKLSLLFGSLALTTSASGWPTSGKMSLLWLMPGFFLFYCSTSLTSPTCCVLRCVLFVLASCHPLRSPSSTTTSANDGRTFLFPRMLLIPGILLLALCGPLIALYAWCSSCRGCTFSWARRRRRRRRR
eukprot:SAG11_NODE_3876_length_2174_cov_2.588632_1_plen_251_part_00